MLVTISCNIDKNIDIFTNLKISVCKYNIDSLKVYLENTSDSVALSGSVSAFEWTPFNLMPKESKLFYLKWNNYNTIDSIFFKKFEDGTDSCINRAEKFNLTSDELVKCLALQANIYRNIMGDFFLTIYNPEQIVIRIKKPDTEQIKKYTFHKNKDF